MNKTYLNGTHPDFPIGTRCYSPAYGAEKEDYFTVISWDRFVQKYGENIKLSPEAWGTYIPVVDGGGNINGIQPQSLVVISEEEELETPIDPIDPTRDTIEI